MNGILSGMPPGILMDPRQAMMLQTGLGLMSASGPSTTPVGLGQAIGKAGMQGLNAFQQTSQLNQQNQLTQLKLAEVQREADERKKKQAALDALRKDPRFASYGALLDVAPAAAIERAIPKPTEADNPFSKVAPKDYTPESWKKFTMTKNYADLVPAVETKSPTSGVQEYEYAVKQGYKGTFEEWDKARKAAGATKLTLDQRGQDAYFQRAGSQFFDEDLNQFSSAQAAVDNIGKLDTVLNHLKTSDAITGLGADLRLQVQRAQALFAKNKEAGKTTSDTELLDAFLGSDVFPMIKALGVGARGLDTPAEREFLRSVMTGTTAMNKDTLIRLTEFRRDVAERAIKKFNDRVEGGEMDRFFQARGGKPKKIDIPKGGGKTYPQPTQAAINRLRMSPAERDMFEAVFGPGSAAKALGR